MANEVKVRRSAGKKKEPITQEQVNDFIVTEIEAITLDTIKRENLGKGMIESDPDMILCMKGEYRGKDAYDDETQETISVPGDDLTLEPD